KAPAARRTGVAKKATKKVAKDPARKTAKKAAKKTAARKAPARRGGSAGRAPPALTSPTKILFPDIRATKQEAYDYYAAVMDHLLPEIAGRPLSIIRCPSGTAKACFFQKHHTAGLELVSSVRLKEESGTN